MHPSVAGGGLQVRGRAGGWWTIRSKPAKPVAPVEVAYLRVLLEDPRTGPIRVNNTLMGFHESQLDYFYEGIIARYFGNERETLRRCRSMLWTIGHILVP